ncbi:MBL fold metallo-hydrolase [Spirillospora sp. NPDC049652]
MPPRKRQPDDTQPPDTSTQQPAIRQSTRPAEIAAKKAKVLQDAQEAAARQAQLRQERADKLAKLPKAPDGNRGDGNFHAVFLQMGQGDCTLMTTPQGHVVMLDCGSDSKEETDAKAYQRRISDVIHGAKFLKDRNIIDVLILTHPDSDHYNQLTKMLKDDVQIDSYYHSSNRVAYSGASGFIAQRCKVACKVNHHDNDGTQVIELVTGENNTKIDLTATGSVPRLDGNGGILVHTEKDCTISLLAGNVNRGDLKDNSNDTNRGSIATLIEVFDQRILMCGDGTINTEAYLLKYHKARLANLDVVQAGHHGSINTSSSQKFVDHVHPKLVVISAGMKIPMHHLPSWETINRYKRVTDRSDQGYVVSSWKTSVSLYDPFTETIFEKIYVTGSRGTFEYTVPPKAVP